jgi:SAM-dependent methyltransferase
MLQLADVSEDDVVYDLGSGDGRIVIFAAKEFGARGVGVEIDPDLVERARRRARRAGVADRVEFRQGDLFKADLSEATVVALYLWPDMNNRLRPKLQRELDPGDRVVSHSFDIDRWPADTTVTLDAPTLNAPTKTIFRWTIPNRTGGK